MKSKAALNSFFVTVAATVVAALIVDYLRGDDREL